MKVSIEFLFLCVTAYFLFSVGEAVSILEILITVSNLATQF
jgi:hypothetical protein